jgi:hypothetical protein
MSLKKSKYWISEMIFGFTDDLLEASYVYDPDAESYEIHEIEKKNLSSITKTSGRINYSI